MLSWPSDNSLGYLWTNDCNPSKMFLFKPESLIKGKQCAFYLHEAKKWHCSFSCFSEGQQHLLDLPRYTTFLLSVITGSIGCIEDGAKQSGTYVEVFPTSNRIRFICLWKKEKRQRRKYGKFLCFLFLRKHLLNYYIRGTEIVFLKEHFMVSFAEFERHVPMLTSQPGSLCITRLGPVFHRIIEL